MMCPKPDALRRAILFGTPVTREEFDAAVHEGRSDFVASVVGDDDPALVWTGHYARVAAAAQDLIRIASELSATVYRRARLSDLTDATAEYDCVILLAHWRGAYFSVRDVTGNLERICERIDRGAYPALAPFRPAPRTAVRLVDEFNDAVKDRRLLEFAPARVTRLGSDSRTFGEAVCRDLLDLALSGLIAPGNQMELFDGLHTMGAVAAAICERFRGELELGVCNSEALATYLDLRMGNRFRHIHWPVAIMPIPQYVLIGTTLNRIAQSGEPYIMTRLDIEGELKRYRPGGER